MFSNHQAFSRTIGLKGGVFQPVTGQAVVVQTTAADDAWADEMHARENDSPTIKKTRLGVPEKDLVSRVESHTIAFKKKNRRRRNRNGAACDLPVFSALNGMSKKEILTDLEFVGVVQTPVNPNDKTKPKGFRTNATRIGGTVSMINTGNKEIHANMPVMWDAPHPDTPDIEYHTKKKSECGDIKGHPEGIIYPATREYREEELSEKLLEAVLHTLESDSDDNVTHYTTLERENKGGYNTASGYVATTLLPQADYERRINDKTYQTRMRNALAGAVASRQRIIGWSLNYAAVGEQLDIILKKG